MVLEHARGFALQEGSNPGIDTFCACRRHSKSAVQILVDPDRQLAKPGLLRSCPFFCTPSEVLFHRVLELLAQFVWRAAIEIDDILDADDAPMEGIR
jgi:hypothetical protein